MILRNQQDVMSDIQKLAAKRQHNILISGSEGCGKTYLAKLFAKEIGIDDFQIVESKVASIKESIDNCIGSTNPLILCIENLDTGINAASYAMLKFLEEPSDNIYIVITCRNIKRVPDTILSRCVTVALSHMEESDLVAYAKERNPEQLSSVQKDEILWRCARSIGDVDTLLNLNFQQMGYFKTLLSMLNSKESVSNIIWKLQKFPDGTSTPIEIVIRYLMYSIESETLFVHCHECLMSLSNGRIGTHAVLAKFAFEIKYTLR